VLPIEAVDDLSASPVGSLTPVLTQAKDIASFTLYDRFDQTLRKERRVLIAVDDRLELWNAEGGASVAVAAVWGLRGDDKALSKLTDRVTGSANVPLRKPDLYGRLFPDHAPYVAKPDIRIRWHDAAFDAACDIIAGYLAITRHKDAGIIADIAVRSFTLLGAKERSGLPSCLPMGAAAQGVGVAEG